jgi:hypothetical protein
MGGAKEYTVRQPTYILLTLPSIHTYFFKRLFRVTSTAANVGG